MASTTPRSESIASGLGVGAAATLGFALPVILAPASKSSPLLFGIATVLAVASVAVSGRTMAFLGGARKVMASPLGLTVLALLSLMAISILWAHQPRASLNQFIQLGAVITAGTALSVALPVVAPQQRAVLFALGIAVAALVIAIDVKSGLQLRQATGGLAVSYRYNRGLVTLTVLLWPVLALVVASGKLWLLAPLAVAVPLGVWAGESGAAVLSLGVGMMVFPIAALVPRFSWMVGLGGTLALLAIQPWFGTLSQQALSQAFHKTFSGAHSGDRVDIWLSFEAAVRANWLFGNGFGSSLDMQKAPVAALVPPERVTLLGASHPHNGFLQLWVEVGLAGAAIAAVVIALVFRAIADLRPALRPFALACFASVAAVKLVSHGAWQAWWWTAILAAVASFALLEAELRRGAPPQ